MGDQVNVEEILRAELRWIQGRIAALRQIEGKLEKMRMLASDASEGHPTAEERAHMQQQILTLTQEIREIDKLSKPLVFPLQ